MGLTSHYQQSIDTWVTPEDMYVIRSPRRLRDKDLETHPDPVVKLGSSNLQRSKDLGNVDTAGLRVERRSSRRVLSRREVRDPLGWDVLVADGRHGALDSVQALVKVGWDVW